jgi:Zn-finger nucleic acid-binding protein
MSETGLASAPQRKNCPICKIEFYPATLAGRDLYHCAECEGTAWPRETLMKTLPADAAKPIELGEKEAAHKTPPYFTPRQKPPFLICPYCQKRMKEQKVGGVLVDICEKCDAVWLDGPKAARFQDLLSPYKHKMSRRD